jgi:hypothetical protein
MDSGFADVALLIHARHTSPLHDSANDCPSFATLAFDAADGKVLWTDRYGDEAFTYGYPARIVASGDGDSFSRRLSRDRRNVG